MQYKTFNILQEEPVNTTKFVSKDSLDLKEESSASVGKAFPGTGRAKSLTGEAAEQDLEVRDVFTLYRRDVRRSDVLTREVMVESCDCRCFDFRSENAAAF